MEELNFPNYMEKHYKDSNVNHFNDDNQTAIDDLKQRNTRLLLRLPNGVKKHGIHNLMKKYGIITSIYIPFDSRSGNNSSSRMIAFVEYETFKEAEKALREINSPANKGLDITVEFARERVTKNNNQEIVGNKEDENEKFEKTLYVPEQLPAKVLFDENLSSDDGDVYEKVTQFEFYNVSVYDETVLKHLEMVRKLASKSEGTYDKDNKCFEYNPRLREYNFVTYYCYVCEREATLKHEKRRRYFCSVECYENEGGIKKVATELEIKKFDKVCLTAVINEKCVYIRPHNKDLDHMLENVNRCAKNIAPLEMMPKVGDFVLVKLFNDNDDIYRAKVLKIIDKDYDDVHIMIQLIDIGNTVRVKHEDLYEMTAECMEIESIVKKVILKDVNVEAIHIDVIYYLLNLLKHKTELIVSNIDENGLELKDNTFNVIINHKIVEMATFKDITMNAVDYCEIPTDLIKCGNNQKLFVLNTSNLEAMGQICCIREKYLKDFYEFYKSLNAYGRTVDEKSFGIKDMKKCCLAKVNDQWHRVFVLSCKGDGKPSCVLLDLQFMCNIDIKNIFPLPEIFSKSPFLSDVYKVHKFSDADKMVLKQSIVENEYIIADKIDSSKEDFVIHLNKFCDCN